MKKNSNITLEVFLEGIYLLLKKSITGCGFDSTQQLLLDDVLSHYEKSSRKNQMTDPLAFFYLVIRTWNSQFDEQTENLAVFCILYILAADLIDDVQDNDLVGKSHEKVGPAIALNNGLTLLFLGLDFLRSVLEKEDHVEQRLSYLEVFNRYSILAVKGQHLDLMGNTYLRTPAEVLTIQKAKTSSLALVVECAAIFAGCDSETVNLYQHVAEKTLLLIQIFDDVNDVFGKSFSPDLATNKMTYLLSTFNEIADEILKEKLDSLLKDLPGSMDEIRQLFYKSGTIKRCAEQIELLRVEIHRDLTTISATASTHRNWLYVVDMMSSQFYHPPIVEYSKPLIQPNGPWYNKINGLANEFVRVMEDFGAPPLPPLIPWHLSHWAYLPNRKAIFYPDLEGQNLEVLLPIASMLKTDDFAVLTQMVGVLAPAVLAHELFHYWRDFTGMLTLDFWFEEWVAFALTTAFLNKHYQLLVDEAISVVDKVLALNHAGISNKGYEIVEYLFETNYKPETKTAGYGFDIIETGLIELLILQKMLKLNPKLDNTLQKFLGVNDLK